MDNIVTMEGVKKTIFGCGSIEQLGAECRKIGASKALLVMDNELSKNDIFYRLEEYFRKARVKFVLYPEVTPEPDPSIADKGAELALKEKVRCIVGFGGGSSMDVAKAIAVLFNNPGRAVDYIGLNKVNKPGLPTIMVPTTAGTGSEVTYTAVFTMRDSKSKGGINSPYLYPDIAILDPELTLDLPSYITAYTGMDALTHAIESFISLKAHTISETISLRAVEIISENLRGAVFHGREIQYRKEMMTGSYMAGQGLAMAGVGAVHALAYPVGALFGIPHGVANAMLLPYVLEYNFPGNIDKFCQLAIAMDQDDKGLSPRELASLVSDAVFDLAGDIGIPMSLKELDIPENAIPEMAEGAMKVEVPISNNPRPITVEIARDIYEQAFEA